MPKRRPVCQKKQDELLPWWDINLWVWGVPSGGMTWTKSFCSQIESELFSRKISFIIGGITFHLSLNIIQFFNQKSFSSNVCPEGTCSNNKISKHMRIHTGCCIWGNPHFLGKCMKTHFPLICSPPLLHELLRHFVEIYVKGKCSCFSLFTIILLKFPRWEHQWS